MLLDLHPAPNEILIIDQSETHPANVSEALRTLNERGDIRWIKRERPSITKAMNHALRVARNELILFLDDDIKPTPDLIENHFRNYSDETIHAVVGQVLQPGETPQDVQYQETGTGITECLAFPFFSKQKTDVKNVMAGNLSVRVSIANTIGGFDENFQFVAYRFETDFARRLIDSGSRIVYEPEAGIHHLRIRTGGTRNRANHLTSSRPDHSLGDYYYAFKHGKRWEAVIYSVKRFIKAPVTKFHIKHPWYIPTVLLGEMRGLWTGWRLACSNGKTHIVSEQCVQNSQSSTISERRKIEKEQKSNTPVTIAEDDR